MHFCDQVIPHLMIEEIPPHVEHQMTAATAMTMVVPAVSRIAVGKYRHLAKPTDFHRAPAGRQLGVDLVDMTNPLRIGRKAAQADRTFESVRAFLVQLSGVL